MMRWCLEGVRQQNRYAGGVPQLELAHSALPQDGVHKAVRNTCEVPVLHYLMSYI
jgi:hypothetical protein